MIVVIHSVSRAPSENPKNIHLIFLVLYCSLLLLQRVLAKIDARTHSHYTYYLLFISM